MQIVTINRTKQVNTKMWMAFNDIFLIYNKMIGLTSSCRKSIHTFALSFYSSQNVLGWSKFFAPDQKFIYVLWQSKHFVPDNKMIYISKIGSCAGTKVLEEAINAVPNFLCWLKKNGPAQKILGPVKGQGICLCLEQAEVNTSRKSWFLSISF